MFVIKKKNSQYQLLWSKNLSTTDNDFRPDLGCQEAIPGVRGDFVVILSVSMHSIKAIIVVLVAMFSLSLH